MERMCATLGLDPRTDHVDARLMETPYGESKT
jgi:hypothetical protein